MTMPYLVLVSLLMTGMLLFITLYQSIQIHFMKVELRKCLKAVKEEKTKEKMRSRSAPDLQISSARYFGKKNRLEE